MSLDKAMSTIHKAYGTDSCYKYGEGIAIKEVSSISTGSFAIDDIIGVGGVPRGRMIEIFGPESSGKTTLCLHILAEAQKQGLVAAFIDAEHALDIGYAKALGVNMPDVLLSQPDYGEQALDIAEKLMESNEIGLIIVDSVAALTPKAEIEGEIGDQQMGLHARLMSKVCRRLAPLCNRTKTTLIFVNQIRSKIGVMFGNPETTTGGNALKFFASVRIDIRRIGSKKDGDRVISNTTRVKIVKNKVHPPFRQCEIDIRFGIGIDNVAGLIDVCINKGIIDKSGAWLSLAGRKDKKYRWQGKENMRNDLLKKKKIEAYLINKLRNGNES